MRAVQAFMVFQLEDAGAPPTGGFGSAAAWDATRMAVVARAWGPPLPGVRLARSALLLDVDRPCCFESHLRACMASNWNA